LLIAMWHGPCAVVHAGLEELSLECSVALSYSGAYTDTDDESSQPIATAKHQQTPAPAQSVQTISGHSLAPESFHQQSSTQWLLPFTDMFSKRRQFAVDNCGRVHLIVGELLVLIGFSASLAVSSTQEGSILHAECR